MKIRNPKADAIPTNLTDTEFAAAMARLDLSGVDPANRPRAVMDHLRRIMIGSIKDPSITWDLAQSALLKGRR